MNHFDLLNSINFTKENLIVDDITEKEYNAFMVNRGLSQFPDTVLIANEMNLKPHIPSKLQNDFLINMVRKRKRFSKWAKAQTVSEIEAIKEYYGYNDEKAHQVLTLLSPDQIKTITQKVNTGGKNK